MAHLSFTSHFRPSHHHQSIDTLRLSSLRFCLLVLLDIFFPTLSSFSLPLSPFIPSRPRCEAAAVSWMVSPLVSELQPPRPGSQRVRALLLLAIRQASISPNARLLSPAKATTAPLTKRKAPLSGVGCGVTVRGHPLSRPLFCPWLPEAATQRDSSQCQMSRFDLGFFFRGHRGPIGHVASFRRQASSGAPSRSRPAEVTREKQGKLGRGVTSDRSCRFQMKIKINSTSVVKLDTSPVPRVGS